MLMESGILRVSGKVNVMPIFAGKESISQGQSDQGLHIFYQLRPNGGSPFMYSYIDCHNACVCLI